MPSLRSEGCVLVMCRESLIPDIESSDRSETFRRTKETLALDCDKERLTACVCVQAVINEITELSLAFHVVVFLLADIIDAVETNHVTLILTFAFFRLYQPGFLAIGTQPVFPPKVPCYPPCIPAWDIGCSGAASIQLLGVRYMYRSSKV